MDKITLRHALFNGGWSDDLQRELFVRDNAVAVLPYDPLHDQVVLIEQFRAAATDNPQGPWLLELIAGMVEPGEALDAVAHRETHEESGLALQALRQVCHYYVSPGGTTEQVTLYIGRVAAANDGQIFGNEEDSEDIRVIVMDLQEALAGIESGRINNGATIIALQWLKLNHQQLRSEWL